jgi:predicted Zn finger-like uncharacterized protein
MIITCKECITSFNLDEKLLKPDGSKVRCSKCQHIFIAYPPVESADSFLIDDTDTDSFLEASEADFGTEAEQVSAQTDGDENLALIDSNLAFDIDEYSEQEKSPEEQFEPVHEISIEDQPQAELSTEQHFVEDTSLPPPITNLNMEELDKQKIDLNGLDEELDLDTDEDFDLENIELTPEDLDLVKDFNPEAGLETPSQPATENRDAGIDSVDMPDDMELSPEDIDLSELTLNTEDLAAADAFEEVQPEAEAQLEDVKIELDKDLAEQSVQEEDRNLDLDIDLDLAEEGVEEPAADELDLAIDLDGDLEEEKPAEADALSDAQDLNLEQKNVLEETTSIEVDKDNDEMALALEPEEFDAEETLDEDLGLTLDLDASLTESSQDVEEADTLDLDLEMDIDETAVGKKNEDKVEDIEGVKEEFDLALEPEESDVEETLDEDLDLTLDLDASLAESSQNDATNEDADIDLNLDLGDDQPAEALEPETTDTFDSDIELDLDLEMDLEEAVTEKKGIEKVEDKEEDKEELSLALEPEEFDDGETLDEDLGLTLDLDANLTESSQDDEVQEAIDIDLDLELEGDQSTETPEPVTADASDADLELDLDLDFEDELKEPAAEDEFDLTLDEIEDKASELKDDDLDLTLDFDEEPAEKAGDDEVEDLDLSDIEQMLASETADDGKAADDSKSNDFSLDDDIAAADGELDLSDIEDILDDQEESEMPAGESADAEEPELTLDLEPEFGEGEVAQKAQDGLTSELDLSEFEYLADENETSPADNRFDAGDMELEFEVEDTPPEPAPKPGMAAAAEVARPDEVLPPVTAEKEVGQEAGGLIDDDLFDDEEAEMTPAKKRGSSKLLIGILIVTIVLGGAYCTYVLLEGMGIKIPFLSQLMKPKVQDPGNLQMATFDINSKFIENNKAGRLFVVTGKVKNSYPETRGFIQLSGKLFTRGKKLVKTELVFGGNMLSDMELSTLEVEAIKKRLSVRFGDKKASMKVAPNKALPFMVVFSHLPKEQLEEFTIEVVKSTTMK